MTLQQLVSEAHAANKRWWVDINTGQPLQRNKGELLALIHSEISEAGDGEFENAMDDKLPHRRMAEVEMADVLIRVFDYAGGFGYHLDRAGLFFGITEFASLSDCGVGHPKRGLEGAHSAVSKVLELERKGFSSEAIAVGLVGIVSMVTGYSKSKGYDLQGAYEEKMEYNTIRPDHTAEQRKKAGGKKF